MDGGYEDIETASSCSFNAVIEAIVAAINVVSLVNSATINNEKTNVAAATGALIRSNQIRWITKSGCKWL